MMRKLFLISSGILLLSIQMYAMEDVIVLEKAEKYNRKLGVSEIKDISAENGKVYSFDGRKGGWSLAFFPIKAVQNKKAEGEWNIYAVLRCDASADKGTAFHIGLHSYRKRQSLFKRNIQISEIRGKEYRTIFIGKTEDLDAELWAGGPARTSGVETIYLDKVILKKTKKTTLPEEFNGRKTIQFQKFRFDSKQVSEIVDFYASDYLACRIKGDSSNWSLFLSPPADDMKLLNNGKNWEIYLELRAEGEASIGCVFEFGLYDQNKKKLVLSRKIPMEYIKDKNYQQIKIGNSLIPPESYFWGGALNNDRVDAIYLDRIILVEKAQEKNK